MGLTAWMLCISDLKLVESALTACRLCTGLQDKKEEGKFPSTLIPQGRWFPEPTLSIPSPGPGQKAPATLRSLISMLSNYSLIFSYIGTSRTTDKGNMGSYNVRWGGGLALPLAFCATLLTCVTTPNMSTSLGEIGVVTPHLPHQGALRSKQDNVGECI